MENSRKSGSILGDNLWAKAFARFDEEVFFSKLHEQVKNKPYYERYLGFKKTLSILSYILSFAGAVTSAYAVYWLACWAGAAVWISLTIGAVILVFLERVKRKASEEAWRIHFFEHRIAPGWVIFSLALLALGVFTSSFGAKEGAEDFAPIVQLITSDSTAQDYKQRIATLEAENTQLSRQRNHLGEIFWPAQKQMARNKETISEYETRIIALDAKREQANDGLKAGHQINVDFASRIFMLVQIFMELAFEGCIAWIWYFYYRSYVERVKATALSTATDAAALTGAIANQEPFPAVVPPQEELLSSPLPAPVNGQIQNNLSNHHSRPIGFYSDAQRDALAAQGSPSVQTRTGLYSEKATVIEDLYTVLHTYQRGGRIYQTPYTENQILARIGQYERELEEAQQKNMDADVLENRNQWHRYWLSKLEELHSKQKGAK